MNKLTLAALVISTSAFITPMAIAADVSSTLSKSASHEYLHLVDKVTSEAVKIQLNDSYAVGDFIILHFDGDEVIDVASLPAAISVEPQSEYDLRTTNFAFNVGDELDHPCDDAVAAYPQFTHWHYESQTTYPWLQLDELCQGYTNDTEHLLRAFAAPDLLVDHLGFTLDKIVHGYDDEAMTTWVKYRFTDMVGDWPLTSQGALVDFGELSFAAAKLLDYDRSYGFSTVSRTNYDNYPDAEGSSPDPLDESEDNSAVLFNVKSQFKLKTDENDLFDQVIDVTTETQADFRRVFEAGTDDTASFVLGAETTGELATLRGSEYVVSGTNMFSWVVDDDANTADIQLASGSSEITFSKANCVVASLDTDELTISCDETVTGTVTVTLTPDAAEKNILNDGKFTVAGTVEYALDGTATETFTKELDSLAFGEWTINGSMTVIPYMPYSAQTTSKQSGLPIDQIVYVTNTSSRTYSQGVEPRVYVSVMDESGVVTELSNSDLGGVRIDHGITKLTGAIREAMYQKGLLTASQKFQLTLTVEENAGNIQVYSAYNVGGSERGWVQNDSQRIYNDNNL